MVIYQFFFMISNSDKPESVFIVTDTLANAEMLFRKNWDFNKIIRIELISDQVLNLWSK